MFAHQPLKNDKYVISKSRYDSLSMYLSTDKYNDVEIPYNEEAYKTLRDNGNKKHCVCTVPFVCCYVVFFFLLVFYPGIDHLLARHVAHLFIRDPVSLFEEKLEQDNENESDHFEVLYITLWWNWFQNSKFFSYTFVLVRTSSQQTGRVCDSSLPHQTLLLDGE